jgi:hypothetical protein
MNVIFTASSAVIVPGIHRTRYGGAGGTPALQGVRVGFVAQPSRLHALDEIIGTNLLCQTIEVS